MRISLRQYANLFNLKSRSNMKKLKDMLYSKKFDYNENQQDYEFQLKTKRNWWWLLLCLLPLLLLIQCERDITVHTHDAENEISLPGMMVSMNYNAHYLFKDMSFFKTDSIVLKQETDSTGTTIFRDLPCSVFSYIFYCLSKVEFSCQSECFEQTKEECLFHFSRTVNLKCSPKKVDLHIKVIDLETEDPLPGATVAYSYIKNGVSATHSVVADANGCATIESFRHCGIVDTLHASCYGYADTCKYSIPAQVLTIISDSSTLKLRPIKKSFTFFVKNVETREPIPGATAEVTITDSRSHVTRGTSTTNVDGKGKGFYEEAFVLAKVGIKASKIHFNDSVLVGDYTVEEFCNLPEEKRVIWLRPEPYVEEFENVDSITGKPIVGVTNTITVTDATGKTETFTEISNRNGKFPVKAKEGSKIRIESKKSPDYEDKITEIPAFDKAETIRMKPNFVSLIFRTLEKESGEILEDCNLVISTTVSGVTSPSNSGSGIFEVEGLRYGEKISISASKTGYKTNDTKIRNEDVNDLILASQSDRDIPLEIDLPPCEGGSLLSRGSGAPLASNASYNMGQRSGTFVLEVEAYSIPDHFTVYDGPDSSYPVLFDGDIQDKRNLTLHFTHSIITIQVNTSGDNSSWNYTPYCPN